MVVCWPLPLDCFQIFLTFFTKHSKDWGARNAGNEIPSLSFYARVKEQCSQLRMGIFRIVLVLQETGVSNVMLSFIVFVKKNKSWDHCHKSKVNYFIGGGLINFEIKACMGLFFGESCKCFFCKIWIAQNLVQKQWSSSHALKCRLATDPFEMLDFLLEYSILPAIGEYSSSYSHAD